MGITVHSPFTGQPVKIREKDVGRAVTDEDGGIFYVLPKADGSGYYGAPTRHGGEKDEIRAADHDNRMGGPRETAGGRQASAPRQHSARAPARSSGQRSSVIGLLVTVALLGAILVGVWAVFLGPFKGVFTGG